MLLEENISFAWQGGAVDFFEVVKKRRSIRKFKADPFPEDAIKKAFDAAVLAPNSSNTQTWDFYWVKNPELKQKVVNACLNQSAARTASHLVVVVADPANWKRSLVPNIEWAKAANAPGLVMGYYTKLIPMTYRFGLSNFFAPFKWVAINLMGLKKPIMRGPYTRRDIEEVGIKSAALASENFMLAIVAQGGAVCPMEGYDDRRLRKLLKLKRSANIVMVIAVGHEADRGTWGPQFRLPIDQVVHTLN